jgi:tripartite-type tricarboxylate transporter receptor subunit TctC
VAAELFKMMAGTDMLLVSYRGVAPAVTDLLGGQVQVMFVTTVSSIEYIKTGRLRALAVTTATRSATLPGIPTMGEFLPGYEATSWYGVGVPRNTPGEIVDRINKEVNAALADPKMKIRLHNPSMNAVTASAFPPRLHCSFQCAQAKMPAIRPAVACWRRWRHDLHHGT